MSNFFLFADTLLILMSAANTYAQQDTIRPDEFNKFNATAKVYFYTNESGAVVKLNDSVIKVNTKKPMRLEYGSYRVEAWAWGHKHYKDTVIIDEPTEMVRITMQRTPEFEAYHNEKRKFYLLKTVTAIPLPAVLIVGGIQYMNFNSTVSSYEDQLAHSSQQALYYKEQYERSLTVENVEDNKRKYNTWKESHTETVNRYNEYLRKTRIKAGIMAALTVASGYALYKFFTLEKPSFSDESPFKNISFQPFQNLHHDTGLTVTFNF